MYRYLEVNGETNIKLDWHSSNWQGISYADIDVDNANVTPAKKYECVLKGNRGFDPEILGVFDEVPHQITCEGESVFRTGLYRAWDINGEGLEDVEEPLPRIDVSAEYEQFDAAEAANYES